MEDNLIKEELMKYCDKNVSLIDRYIKFINFCREFNSIKLEEGIYVENHHIIPKSINENYSDLRIYKCNGIYLTARQHFLAHWILAKAVGQKMWNALHIMMTTENEHQERYKISKNSRLYEKIRLKSVENRIVKVWTEEDRYKLSVKYTGSGNPRYGVELSEETKTKISNSSKGRHLSEETKAKIFKSSKEYWESERSDEFRKKLSIRLKNTPLRPKGFTLSDEQKKAISIFNSNSIWITNGEIDKRIRYDDEIPTGFKKGRSNLSLTNHTWYTNGMDNIRLKDDEIIPSGYYRGVSKDMSYTKDEHYRNKISKTISEQRSITNGKITKKIHKNDPVPEGFRYGSLSKTVKNKIWVNNGVNEKYIDKDLDILFGYKRGRLKREKPSPDIQEQ